MAAATSVRGTAERDIAEELKGYKRRITYYTDENGVEHSEQWVVTLSDVFGAESSKLNRRLGLHRVNKDWKFKTD